MPLSPQRWKRVTESAFPWEAEAVEYVRAALPDCDPYAGWSNFSFISSDRTINEVDALVATKRFHDEAAEPALRAGNDCHSAFESHGYSPDDHASGYRVSPPQAKMVWPVTYDASFEARKAKTDKISSAFAACPIGI
jgi:hypothetical protein